MKKRPSSGKKKKKKGTTLKKSTIDGKKTKRKKAIEKKKARQAAAKLTRKTRDDSAFDMVSVLTLLYIHVWIYRSSHLVVLIFFWITHHIQIVSSACFDLRFTPTNQGNIEKVEQTIVDVGFRRLGHGDCGQAGGGKRQAGAGESLLGAKA